MYFPDYSKQNNGSFVYRRDSVVGSPLKLPKKIKIDTSISQVAMAMALNECLDKLTLLRIIVSRNIEDKWDRQPYYRLPEEKYGAQEEDFNLYQYTPDKKFAKDAFYIQNILKDTISELLRCNTADIIHTTADIFDMERRDEFELNHELKGTKRLLHDITYELTNSTSKNNSIYEKKLDEVYNIDWKAQDLVFFSEVKLRYVDKYETNRNYLNDLTNTKREQELIDLIEDYEQNENMENCVHDQIEEYLHCSNTQMEEEIEHWMVRYDEDVERLDKDIYEMKTAREKLETEFMDLKNEYKSRSEEMQLWLELKEEIRKKEELERIIKAAVVKIQAWWRGVMVRRHLGRYRKKKKGKKGKGKSNKQKQKKKKK